MALVNVAAALGIVYLVTTIGLTVILEVQPYSATYAPALFPILAVVGAVNLVLIARQEQREDAIRTEKEQRKTGRQETAVSNNGDFDTVVDTPQLVRQSKREKRKEALLEFYRTNPIAGPTEASQAIDVSRQTVYTYQQELVDQGILGRNGSDEWEVAG